METSLKLPVNLDFEVKNSDLIPFYSDDILTNIFPLHVLEKNPERESLAISEDGVIKAASVNGMMYGNFEVFSHWIKAEDETSFVALLEKMKNEGGGFINCEFKWKPVLDSLKFINEYPVDFFFIREPGESLEIHNEDLELVELNERTLPNMELSDEIKKQIGAFSDFPVGSRFWGLKRGNSLLAIADALVMYGDAVSISQVYTLESERGKGIGRDIVARVVNNLSKMNITSTYLVSEENIPSIRLARSLDFELKNKFCFSEIKERK